jgi:hypothetical protein
VATVAFTPLKKEASAELSFIGEVLSNGTGDYRFANAYHTIKLKYTFVALIASLAIYLSKEFRLNALIASGIMFFIIGIERGVIGKL